MKTKFKMISTKKLFYLVIALLIILSIYLLMDASSFVEGFRQGFNS